MSASTDKSQNDSLSRASYSAMSSATDITIMMWINSDISFSGENPYLLGTGLAGPMTLTCDNGKFGVVMKDGSGSLYANATTTATSSLFTSGTWYHLTVVWSQSVDAKSYINGVLQTTSTWLGTTPSSVTASSATLLVGGLTLGVDTVSNFDGKIAYGRIYTRALSISEILESYYNSQTNLKNNVGFWNLLGASSNLVKDLSGSAYDLTNNASIGTESSVGPPVFMDAGGIM